ncbi:protein TonB [Gulbenkiania mobilis]|uniref:Protein TonB n=1 Tax=Gulbenkiania mobilis TaxID=397457 RepID=A0ABY2D1N9_GULMO|nr:protein TonB [Gulbenkiania mobilis]
MLFPALLASLLLHALLLIPAGPRKQEDSGAAPFRARQIDIRLQPPDKVHPPATERVAPVSRAGSGNTSRPDHLASRRLPAPIPATPPPPPRPEAAPVPETPAPAATPPKVMRDPARPDRRLAEAPTPKGAPVTASTLLAQAATLAREGGTDMQDNSLESGPRTAVYGVSARGAVWAQYVQDWILKVERIGTLNYPEEARTTPGGPVLRVVVGRNGSLQKVAVVRTSGNPAVDEAARRIVRMAAPFPPLPASVAAEYGALVIEKRWMFTTDSRMSGQ